MSNEVLLENWDAQPVHCPFCGEALPQKEGVSCKHLLYIISAGHFCFRSDLLDVLPGISPGYGPEFSQEDSSVLGKPYDAANRVHASLPVSMEYQLYGPTDSTFVGFAALDSALCGWGVDHTITV